MMTPPAARAEKIWMMRLLTESTRETAETAALPTLVTITVSNMPMREFRSCSSMRGISRAWMSFL